MRLASILSLILVVTACAQVIGPRPGPGSALAPPPDHVLDVPGEVPEIPRSIIPQPGGHLEPPEADSVVFVVDRSCSMGWGASSIEVPGSPHATPWQAALYELRRAIMNLDVDATFGVVLFNHSHEMWLTYLVTATHANKASATAWSEARSASGGTTYVPPVSAAINIGFGPPEVVMFLSDGAPSEGYAAVPAITAVNGGQCIINTVAFGVGGSALQIMQDIANQNGGSCRVIP